MCSFMLCIFFLFLISKLNTNFITLISFSNAVAVAVLLFVAVFWMTFWWSFLCSFSFIHKKKHICMCMNVHTSINVLLLHLCILLHYNSNIIYYKKIDLSALNAMIVMEYMKPNRVNYRLAWSKRSIISLSYFTAFNISQLLTIAGITIQATKRAL